MKNKDFESYRRDVAGEISGIVLEIGFGSGLNLPYYANIDTLYALDPSHELYDLAQQRIEKVSFRVEHLSASAENIPLPDSMLDCVVSTWSLCSIPYPEVALREVFRVLKPGGKVVFVEHGRSPEILIAGIQDILNPISKCLAGGCNVNRDMEKLILAAGFEMQNIEKFSQKSKPLGFMYKGVGIAKK